MFPPGITLSLAVCSWTFLSLSLCSAQEWESSGSGSGQSPNPNNPSEYCSTIPPLQQAQASGALSSPPPTVMVPVGVLKPTGTEGKTPHSYIHAAPEVMTRPITWVWIKKVFLVSYVHVPLRDTLNRRKVILGQFIKPYEKFVKQNQLSPLLHSNSETCPPRLQYKFTSHAGHFYSV